MTILKDVRRRLVVLAAIASLALLEALATPACGGEGSNGALPPEAGRADVVVGVPAEARAACNAGVVPASGEKPASDDGCPAAAPGPAMVNAGAFCIDSTEVTNAQYLDFLQGGPGVPSRAPDPPACDFKQGHSPGAGPNGQGTDCKFDAVGRPNEPVGCVDWCDAFSYCAWAGKRLCGRVGGGALGSPDLSDPKKGEWLDVCSSGGRFPYPYGNAYDAYACNTADCNAHAVPVRQAQACRGKSPPFDRVFDMSGNVDEWIDACDTQNAGAQDQCWSMGGGFGSEQCTGGPSSNCAPNASQYERCDTAARSSRDNNIFPDTGIRCCADITSSASDAGADGPVEAD